MSAAPFHAETRLAPTPLRVVSARAETEETVTIVLERPANGAVATGAPGQFNMLYPFGLGEAAISISGDTEDGSRLVHTVRAVGPVSAAIGRLRAGDTLGVRGPFGIGWPIERARGRDVVLVAGGIGLAPLRPVIYAVLRDRAAFGRLLVLYGARQARDMLFRDELAQWEARSDLELYTTLDTADAAWTGRVGFVTAPLPTLRFQRGNAVVMACGPEIMMRATANALLPTGVRADAVFVSMERNMKCAAGLCGHCQFGPHFVCKDGPVFPYGRVRELMTVREI
jgi:NAD(P)H-flavin reductase